VTPAAFRVSSKALNICCDYIKETGRRSKFSPVATELALSEVEWACRLRNS
jgi:hypothetical protein